MNNRVRTTAALMSYPRARRLYLEQHRRLDARSVWAASLGPLAQPTIEHVVPRSVLGRHGHTRAVGDLHNFVLYPMRLNSVRGPSRLAEDSVVFDLAAASSLRNVLRMYDTQGHALLPPWTPEVLAGQVDAMRAGNLFAPPRRLRGRIARAVAYMTYEYGIPLAAASNVLDVATLLAWHLRYPVTPTEEALERWAASVQGTTNVFVRHPELLARTLTMQGDRACAVHEARAPGTAESSTDLAQAPVIVIDLTGDD